MGIFSKNLRKDLEEEVFNDTLIGPQGNEQEERLQYFFEGFNYSDGPDEFIEKVYDTLQETRDIITDRYSSGVWPDSKVHTYNNKLDKISQFIDGIDESNSSLDDWQKAYEDIVKVKSDIYSEDQQDDYDDEYDEDDELFEETDSKLAVEDNAEVILSTYDNYRLFEVTEDDEVYYIIMAPDGSVMTEDFYSWAESEGIDFDVLPTSDKVARFADYVDSIK